MSDFVMETTTSENVMTADDMIRANGAAEARQAEELRETVGKYSAELEELRSLYEKNSKLVSELRDMNVATTKGIQDVMKEAAEKFAENNNTTPDIDFTELQKSILDSVQASQEKTADLLQQSDDFSHKENVRVYRNIQAATDQLLKKQTETFEAALEPLKTPAKPKATGVQIATLVFAVLILLWNILDSTGIFGAIFKMF